MTPSVANSTEAIANATESMVANATEVSITNSWIKREVTACSKKVITLITMIFKEERPVHNALSGRRSLAHSTE